MKTVISRAGVMLCALGLGLLDGGCSKKESAVTGTEWSLDKSAVSSQLTKFLAAQEVQARKLAAQEKQTPPPEFDSFFAAAKTGDWQTATNLFQEMSKKLRNSQARGAWWQATLDAYGVFELFPSGDEKYAIAFGQDIAKSIPEGSLYFGGTDPGRFLVTALVESHVDGNPFFVLSQNPLADPDYVNYLRSMYGEKIYIPGQEDSQRCFQDYMEDAQERLKNHQLKPGEEVRTDANGHVQVSGQMSVIAIRGRIAKVMFDQNTNREIYVEESFPVDWMYPYLEPHGLIMKINRQPLAEISEASARADHDYWGKYIAPMIGDWLSGETTVEEVTAFAEKIYVKHDLNGFKGDPHFVQSAGAQKEFSKLRSSLAGLYAWRLGLDPSGGQVPAEYTAKGDPEKERMRREADFAFKQAFALCPSSPEAVIRYVAFLTNQGRKADALLIAQTAAHVDPGNEIFNQVATSLSR